MLLQLASPEAAWRERQPFCVATRLQYVQSRIPRTERRDVCWAQVKARKAADAAKAAKAPDPAVEEAAILQAEIDFYRISGITPPADSPAAAILMAGGVATADARAAAGDAPAAAAGTSGSGSAARNGKEAADQSAVGAPAS